MTNGGQVVGEVSPLPEVLEDCDLDALRRLDNPQTALLTTATARTKTCPNCDRRVTVGTDGLTEYGHRRGLRATTNGPRCSARPEGVDPRRECGRA